MRTEPSSAGLVASHRLVAFTAAAGAEIDRLFRAAMAAAGRAGGPGLRSRHAAAHGVLIEFRTALVRPDGFVSAACLAETTRYRDPGSVEAELIDAVDRGAIIRDADGTIRPTVAGHAFLGDVYATQALALASRWPDEVCARVSAIALELVAAAAAAPVMREGAFAAMTPTWEPPGTPATVLLLNRLSALRYHRSDAHATAWREAGLTATQMIALQDAGGPMRDAIETRTNEIASPPFAILDDRAGELLLSDIRSLG